jgi:hypothetical protein
MKLSKNTEYAIIGALILYLAFLPPVQAIKTALSNPVGKAVALATIVYVWKCISPIIAVLLAVGYLRCVSNVWEMFSGAEAECTCGGTGFTYDKASQKCKNASGQEGEVIACTCASGYAWDVTNKQCKAVSGEQPPIPVLPADASPAPAAPAASTGPVTSTAPMTTPGAAQEMASGSMPQPPTGGVQPGAGTVSTAGTV